MGLFNKIFGSYSEKEVKRVMQIVEKINGLEENISKLSLIDITELSSEINSEKHILLLIKEVNI